MNSTEPQSASPEHNAQRQLKFIPPLLAGVLLLVTLALHFMLPEERAVGLGR